MELTLKRGDFLNELSLMQGVVERKNTIPILSNILLKASDGHLDLTSTDLDLTLLSSAVANVARPGSVTVPARNSDQATAAALAKYPGASVLYVRVLDRRIY